MTILVLIVAAATIGAIGSVIIVARRRRCRSTPVDAEPIASTTPGQLSAMLGLARNRAHAAILEPLRALAGPGVSVSIYDSRYIFVGYDGCTAKIFSLSGSDSVCDDRREAEALYWVLRRGQADAGGKDE